MLNDDQETDPKLGLVPRQLVYIRWNLAFIPSPDTKLKDIVPDLTVANHDITPPCNSDRGVWFIQTGQPAPMFELFPAGVGGSPNVAPVVDWAGALHGWPLLAFLTVFTGDEDANLEFTFGLRRLGSTDQTIFSFYDGSKGFRSLANAAGTSSWRKLFNFK